jgi:hypothetical protein
MLCNAHVRYLVPHDPQHFLFATFRFYYPMSSRSRSLPPQTEVSSPEGPAQGEVMQTPMEFADALINLPDDFMLDLGTVDPRDTVFSMREPAGFATVSQPPGPAHSNPFDLGLVAHGTPQGPWNPNSMVPLTPREVEMLKGLSERVHTLETDYQEAKQHISKLEKYCRYLQDDNRLPVIEATRPIRSAHRHQPYPEQHLYPPRLERQEKPSRYSALPPPHLRNLPLRHDTSCDAAAIPPPDDDVDMRPAGKHTDRISIPIAPSPACIPAAAVPHASEGSRPPATSKSSKKVPVAAADYCWVDSTTGARHALHVTKAGLPLFPGPVTSVYQALQGSAKSPAELLRRIWLLYQGRKHLSVWKNAVSMMRDVRHKVALSPPLQLLLELDMLPTNQWEHITKLWRSSSSPLSSISPGIQFNPNGFAGLNNFDIKTADLIGVWTGGNLKTISIACGREMVRGDVKQTFHITLSSPNYWTVHRDELQAWTLSTQLNRIKYVGRLDPELVVTWLRDEVGLTAYDVLARFAPFEHQAYDTDVITNPRASFTSFTPPEAPPSSTDDSLSDFGDDLKWTPACGPRSPALKPRQSDAGHVSSSGGPADAPSMPIDS